MNVAVCPATGASTVTPPAPSLVGSIAIGATGAAAEFTFSAWTLSDVYTGCGVSTGYDIVASASALTYVKYPKTSAVGCTTLTACLDIEVLNTAAPVSVSFILRCILDFGQTAVLIPVTIWVSACTTATITAPVNPGDMILDRSATAGATHLELMSTAYTSLYVLSSPVSCPLMQLDLADSIGVALANPSVVLQNGGTPATADIKVVIDTAFTLPVKLYGSIAGYQAFESFSVRVCGAETISNTTNNILSYAFSVPPGTPASMATATRYETLTEASLSAWFLVTPSADPCVIKDYTLLSAYSPETAWSASDPLIGVSGTIGAHTVKIDKTVVTSLQKTIYIKASTRGLVSAWV